VKSMLTQLLNISGHQLGHKIIIPNDNTLILYDVPEWDETMHSWIRQKIPGCAIHIMSMHESISGFAVVFRIDPPKSGFLTHLSNSCILLFLCAAAFVVFSQINSLTSAQQQHMYDPSKDTPLKHKYDTHHDEKVNETHRDQDWHGRFSKQDTQHQPTPDVDYSRTIASALVAPMVESVFGSLFRQAVDAWGWPIEKDTEKFESWKQTPKNESSKREWEIKDEVPEPYWLSNKRKVREF